MTRETKLIWWLGSRPDATEGPMARIEKRPPHWSDVEAHAAAARARLT